MNIIAIQLFAMMSEENILITLLLIQTELDFNNSLSITSFSKALLFKNIKAYKSKSTCSQLLNSLPKRRTSCFGFGNG